MAITQLEDFKSFDGSLPRERWNNLSIYMCEDNDYRDMFLDKIIEVNLENKSKLRELLGGTKVYTTIKETKSNINYYKINELLSSAVEVINKKYKLGSSRWHIENNKSSHFLEELNRLVRLLDYARNNDADEKDLLEILKLEYFYNDDVVKMRNIPKLTRLFRMIYDKALSRWGIDENYESVVAQIMDELGRKPKNYIMEISTDPIDILTCSVSKNFTSCFDINRGGCNIASTNYLAIDRTTAILKIYELNDKNVVCMEHGTLDFRDAVARAFVSFDVDDNKRMVIGRLYPDDKILNYEDLKTILLPLLKCQDTSKGDWVEDMVINYGGNYVGYADYNESWNVGYMATSNCKRLSVADMGMIFFNPVTLAFDSSNKYYLNSNTLWELTDTSRHKLEMEYIKHFDIEKEEIESNISGTTHSFYTIPNQETLGEILAERVLTQFNDTYQYIGDAQPLISRSVAGTRLDFADRIATINEGFENNA
jgi:hypothetical protein